MPMQMSVGARMMAQICVSKACWLYGLEESAIRPP